LKDYGNISTDDEALRKVKAILMEVVPHLLAKNGSKHQVFGANTYLMHMDSSFLGLALKRDQLQHELGWLKTPLIESLGCDVFAKVRYTSQVFTDTSLGMVEIHPSSQVKRKGSAWYQLFSHL